MKLAKTIKRTLAAVLAAATALTFTPTGNLFDFGADNGFFEEVSAEKIAVGTETQEKTLTPDNDELFICTEFNLPIADYDGKTISFHYRLDKEKKDVSAPDKWTAVAYITYFSHGYDDSGRKRQEIRVGSEGTAGYQKVGDKEYIINCEIDKDTVEGIMGEGQFAAEQAPTICITVYGDAALIDAKANNESIPIETRKKANGFGESIVTVNKLYLIPSDDLSVCKGGNTFTMEFEDRINITKDDFDRYVVPGTPDMHVHKSPSDYHIYDLNVTWKNGSDGKGHYTATYELSATDTVLNTLFISIPYASASLTSVKYNVPTTTIDTEEMHNVKYIAMTGDIWEGEHRGEYENIDWRVDARYGQELEVPSPEPFKVGYTFGGWKTIDGQDSPYVEYGSDGKMIFKGTSDLNLYAKWIPNEISFDFVFKGDENRNGVEDEGEKFFTKTYNWNEVTETDFFPSLAEHEEDSDSNVINEDLTVVRQKEGGDTWKEYPFRWFVVPANDEHIQPAKEENGGFNPGAFDNGTKVKNVLEDIIKHRDTFSKNSVTYTPRNASESKTVNYMTYDGSNHKYTITLYPEYADEERINKEEKYTELYEIVYHDDKIGGTSVTVQQPLERSKENPDFDPKISENENNRRWIECGEDDFLLRLKVPEEYGGMYWNEFFQGYHGWARTDNAVDGTDAVIKDGSVITLSGAEKDAKKIELFGVLKTKADDDNNDGFTGIKTIKVHKCDYDPVKDEVDYDDTRDCYTQIYGSYLWTKFMNENPGYTEVDDGRQGGDPFFIDREFKYNVNYLSGDPSKNEENEELRKKWIKGEAIDDIPYDHNQGLHFYVQWNNKVFFDCNGGYFKGNQPSAVYVNSGETVGNCTVWRQDDPNDTDKWVEHKGQDQTPATPEKPGYDFAGWQYYNDAHQLVDFNCATTKIFKPTYVYASWTPIKPSYTFKFNANDGTGTVGDVTVNMNTSNMAQMPQCNFTKANSTFLRWSTSKTEAEGSLSFRAGENVKIGSQLLAKMDNANEITLYAIWENATISGVTDVIKSVEVPKNADKISENNTNTNNEILVDNVKVENASVEIKAAEASESSAMNTAFGTIKAQFGNGNANGKDMKGDTRDTRAKICKTFDITLNGGSKAITELSKPIVLSISVAGFNFAPDWIPFIIRKHNGEYERCPAKYDYVNKVVYFETDKFSTYAVGGAEPCIIKYADETNKIIATKQADDQGIAQKHEYKIGGKQCYWFTDSAKKNLYDFTTPIADGTTLYAGGAPTFTVTFNPDGGSNVSDGSVEYGQTLTAPEAPTKNDKVFAGWYDGDTLFDFTKPVTKTSNFELKAKWADKAETPTADIATPADKGGDASVAIKDAGVQIEGTAPLNTALVKVVNGTTATIVSPKIVVAADDATNAGANAGVTPAEKSAFNALAAKDNKEVEPIVALDISVKSGTDINATKVDNVVLQKPITMTFRLGAKLPDKYNDMLLYMYHQIGGGTNNIEKFPAFYDGALTISFTIPKDRTLSPFTLVAEKPKTSSGSGSSTPVGYTITWNIDGKTSTEPAIENSTAEYKGETPTKAADANYTYVFKGWDKPFTTVHSDVIYTAVFEAVPKNPGATTAVTETTATTSTTVTTKSGTLGFAKNIRIASDRKTVSWDPAENATSYKVEKIIGDKTFYSGEVTGTSYTFKNVTNGAFKVKVVSINVTDKKWSSAKSAAARKLGTVINPKVSADGTVTWDAAYGAVSYNVGKIIGSKTYYIKNVKTNTAKFKSVPKGEYKVFVEAVDKNGNKTIGTQAKFGSKVAKATNVVIGEDGKTVTWTKVTGAKKYQLVKLVNGTRYYTAKTTKTTASFSNAVKDGTYVYVITFDKNGKTSYSDAVTIS